jgi:magnesium chelatase family protein
VPGVQVVGADHLSEVVRWLRGEEALGFEVASLSPVEPSGVDLAEVRGQALARHALEVAAAGAHHLLMVGPPGCGKSMLARRLPSILPPLTFAEALETTRVHSVAGLVAGGALVSERPFRAPHHSVTVAGLIGDQMLRPGEIALAHHGVLFLDEATEFARPALEVLRQPLEEGVVRLCRARGTVEYPAHITLVMACNPCACGKRGVSNCSCPDGVLSRYQRRLSGPILDRIDLHLELQPLAPRSMMEGATGESSATVRERVIAARERQRARGQRLPNGQVSGLELERIAQPTAEARELLVQGADQQCLSGRATSRLLRVARTLADLAGDERVDEQHITGALALRPTSGWT